MKNKYSIGDVFKLKLKNNDIAFGVVIRANFKGTVLGFFFKSAKSLKLKDGLVKVNLDKIVLRCLFGDLGIIKKKWKIIGKVSKDHEIFKMPVLGFYRLDDDDNKYYVTEYDQDLAFFFRKKASQVYVKRQIY
ncbi:MAG: hypothetical protein IPK31_18915 [Chitinophagaceae bacterium]|nr:hypothetical protein [Chitinophagaceae bacterium]